MDDPTTTRRGALRCMAWAGAGLLWTVAGGVPIARLIGDAEAAQAAPTTGGLRFLQISDSHIGFKHPPNPDTPGTLQAAVSAVRADAGGAALLLHTGDITHLSRDDEFDTAAQIIGTAGLPTRYVPGEHDLLENDGAGFYARFTKGAARGWQSFDIQGVHFVGLNNVADLKPGGMGNLGSDQLDWLKRDLAHRPASQPIVVFAHVPLWTVYAPWGWGTDDAAAALGLLARFGSVTVLNGHIHQIMQKVEGQVTFHTARSTAFPQPSPGAASGPGPIKDVPPGKLRGLLGVTEVRLAHGAHALALTDTVLA
jgi:3',5'-cyclic AMP phosphodiesterase CpdA